MRTMGTDVLALVCLLDHERIALVGHDRGARVATRFAKDHRDVVDRLVVMDNIPTRIIFDTMDAASAKLQWWFLFQLVPHLPEALIAGREEIWLRHFFGQWSYDPRMLTDDEIAVYTRAYSQPGAVRGRQRRLPRRTGGRCAGRAGRRRADRLPDAGAVGCGLRCRRAAVRRAGRVARHGPHRARRVDPSVRAPAARGVTRRHRPAGSADQRQPLVQLAVAGRPTMRCPASAALSHA